MTVREPPRRAWTTSRESARKKGRPWLAHLGSCDMIKDRHYAFTDGSSLGGYAAVFLTPSLTDGFTGHTMKAESQWQRPTHTRNVGAEWRGLLLGLKWTPPGVHATIVTDYLWSLAQLIGVRKALEPETAAQLAEALAVIREKEWESLMLIHHPGHQVDETDFTIINNEADRLCGERNKAAKEAGLTA